MNSPTVGPKQLLDLEVKSIIVRGIRGDAKRRKLLHCLKTGFIQGVIFLQETHSTEDIKIQ